MCQIPVSGGIATTSPTGNLGSGLNQSPRGDFLSPRLDGELGKTCCRPFYVWVTRQALEVCFLVACLFYIGSMGSAASFW